MDDITKIIKEELEGKFPFTPPEFKAKLEKETGLSVTMRKGSLGGSMRGYMSYRPRRVKGEYPTFDINYVRELRSKYVTPEPYPSFYSIDTISVYIGDTIYNY